MAAEDTPSHHEIASNVRAVDLCILYADHDSCPGQEVTPEGILDVCSCSCHLDPASHTAGI